MRFFDAVPATLRRGFFRVPAPVPGIPPFAVRLCRSGAFWASRPSHGGLPSVSLLCLPMRSSAQAQWAEGVAAQPGRRVIIVPAFTASNPFFRAGSSPLAGAARDADVRLLVVIELQGSDTASSVRTELRRAFGL